MCFDFELQDGDCRFKRAATEQPFGTGTNTLRRPTQLYVNLMKAILDAMRSCKQEQEHARG
jgi:hypothetical protein